MCQPHPNGIDLRNFKLKKRCPNHNYKRWKIVTQCSKYRTTAEPTWILYNSSKTKPAPPSVFHNPWKVTHFPNENSSLPTIFQLLCQLPACRSGPWDLSWEMDFSRRARSPQSGSRHFFPGSFFWRWPAATPKRWGFLVRCIDEQRYMGFFLHLLSRWVFLTEISCTLGKKPEMKRRPKKRTIVFSSSFWVIMSHEFCSVTWYQWKVRIG